MRKNILLTGPPQVGKSTLLNKVIISFPERTGLATNEIREDGKRTGFAVETAAGERFVIASVNFQTDFRVAKYFVNLENLEAALPKAAGFKDGDLLYLDEIGQMQLASDNFKKLARSYFDADNTCLATISQIHHDDFTEEIKKRQDIIIVEVSEGNRISIEKCVTALIGKIAKARRYLQDADRFIVREEEAYIKTDHGLRSLKKTGNIWSCDCDFFQNHNICSHLLAIDEYLRFASI